MTRAKSRTIEEALKLLQQWDYYADNSEPALTNQRKLALKDIETMLLDCLPEYIEWDWADTPNYETCRQQTKANLLKILGGEK